jgi:hypothetical protein
MFPEQLKKILQLIKTTGDRVIVYDPSAPDDSYVILDFDRYSSMIKQESPVKPIEEIVKEPVKQITPEPIKETVKVAPKDLPTEVLEELSISEQKSLNIKEELIKDFVKDSVKSENLTENDLTDKINREISMWKNRDDVVYLDEEDKPKKAWQIPSQVKNNAQVVE